MLKIREDARIGVVHHMAFPEAMASEGTALEALKRIAADDYFEVVEVAPFKDALLAREASRLLAESRMTVALGVQGVLLRNQLSLNALDGAERAKAVEAIRACFDQAAILNAVGVAVIAGPYEPGTKKQAEAALVDSLIELSKAAAGFGLNFMLEVFDDSIDKKVLVGKAAVARSVGEQVRGECENFGLMEDLSHLPLLGESPREALEPVGHLVTHVHIGNAVLNDKAHPAYGDKHPPFGVPGGENDVDELAEFLRVLYEIGYLGAGQRRIVSFEVKPLPGQDSEMVLAGSKRVLNEAARRLE